MSTPEPAPDPTPGGTPEPEPETPPGAAPAEPAEPAEPAQLAAAHREPQARQINPAAPRGGMNLRAAAVAGFNHLRNGRPPEALAAALQDFVPADDVGLGIIRPQWVGELWQATTATRPLVDAISRAILDSLTVVGFQWGTRFEVDPYTGNKTAIPSKKVTTEAVTATAVRWAGGLDIDRVFIDLGSPTLIETLFTQAANSYIVETETYVSTALLAAASPVTATDVLDFLIQAGLQAATIGASVSFVVVSGDLFATFAALKSADVPWWLDNGDGSANLGNPAATAGGMAFAVDPNLPAGTAIAGDRRAATFYEQGSTPIRVQAQNIPNGGVDIAAFGYGALIVNDADALWKTTITVAPGGASAKTAK